MMRESSYNYAPMETQASWGNTKSPQPEAQSFMAPDLHEQCFSVSHENTNAEMPYQQWNEQQQQENGRPERHSLPQVEVVRDYVEPAAPMKFVPPPPPPEAAFEILHISYLICGINLIFAHIVFAQECIRDACYKDEIDTTDEQQVEEKKQRCRSYGLHLQYRSAMRWYDYLERVQMQWVSKEDPCPVPTLDVADSPAAFLDWNRAAYQWWMRWFEHAQKKWRKRYLR